MFVYFGEEEDGKEGDGQVDRGEEGHNENHVLAPFLDQVWLSKWKTNVFFISAGKGTFTFSHEAQQWEGECEN